MVKFEFERLYLGRKEEDGEERRERHKALKRIKQFQQDYPDMLESLLDPYKCNAFTRIWAFKALEQALYKYVLDTEAEDYDPEFNFIWAISQLKADLRVLCFPDGGDEYDQWLDAADP